MFRLHVFACLAAATLVAPANAGITEWLAEVADGSPAGFTATGIASPTTADIGVYDDQTNGGVTYEFIVNAVNGGGSSVLMGSTFAPAGDWSGLKFEQWENTGRYGGTDFGVADYDSGIPNIVGADHQVVFVADGTNTAIYVNGVLTGSIAGFSPALSGVTGLAQAYSHINGVTIDPLNGTLVGVAVYDSALGAGEILEHYAAFAIPEPGSIALAALGAVAIGLFARRHA